MTLEEIKLRAACYEWSLIYKNIPGNNKDARARMSELSSIITSMENITGIPSRKIKTCIEEH